MKWSICLPQSTPLLVFQLLQLCKQPKMGPSESSQSLTRPLQAARDGSGRVRDLEHDLARFLADARARRLSLGPFPREWRALVHELAGHYGLASQGRGQEPRRCIDLLKAPCSAAPARYARPQELHRPSSLCSGSP